MVPELSLQELLIVIAANNFSPAVINHEFLQHSGVLPESWELIEQPVYSPEVVQLKFNTGVVLTVQAGRVILAESLSTQSLANIQIAEFAQRLINALPNLQYQAIGFNPTGHYQPVSGETASFFQSILMNPGPWFNLSETKPKMTLNFAYQLDRCPLNLTIAEAGLREDDESVTSVVVFSGNFNYIIGGSTAAERQAKALESLQHWQTDVQQYEQFVNQNFLSAVNSEPTVVPASGLLPAFQQV